jgi:hypothetical protein
MTRLARGRISVDLGALRGALFERARAQGMRPSDVVRASLAGVLGAESSTPRAPGSAIAPGSDRVRLTLRLDREDAAALVRAARVTGLSPGDYVAGLIAGVPILVRGAGRVEHLAALTTSSATLSTLSRDIRHLTSLLRQSSLRAAQQYRDMLDTLAGDIHRHLALASAVLADLRPLRKRAVSSSKETS